MVHVHLRCHPGSSVLSIKWILAEPPFYMDRLIQCLSQFFKEFLKKFGLARVTIRSSSGILCSLIFFFFNFWILSWSNAFLSPSQTARYQELFIKVYVAKFFSSFKKPLGMLLRNSFHFVMLFSLFSGLSGPICAFSLISHVEFLTPEVCNSFHLSF